MKKVLFATTALVATAGVAAAEVSLSGYAEMGVAGGDAQSAAGVRPSFSGETQFHSDIDVTFSLSGETDNGLTFGATIDLDEEGGFGSYNGGPEAVFISGAFGTLTLGDTDGAFDWALQEVGIGTSLGDEHTTHAGFNFNSGFDGTYDGQILRYDNTFGDFGVALSAEVDDTGVGSTAWGIGAKYNAALGGVDLGVGLGYQDSGDASGSNVWGISVDAKFGGGFRGIVSYSDGDTGAGNGIAHDGVDTTSTNIGLGYTTGALTVTANYGEYDNAGVTQDGYGLGVNYDLGGGAVIMAGYGSDGDATLAGDQAMWSIGLGLSF